MTRVQPSRAAGRLMILLYVRIMCQGLTDDDDDDYNILYNSTVTKCTEMGRVYDVLLTGRIQISLHTYI